MFCAIGTSRLVHPNSAGSRYPVWQLKHYEMAGKVVGKCLFESAAGDAYRQMVNARFSRSFIAQILGIPPNYQVKYPILKLMTILTLLHYVDS
jgi:hypothetical protein